ncbi:hypothetical protein ACSVH2_08820 [Flavobacterium sp. RSB2_4_14]|uniref:hypothetical protein n=1 Tax=Flavobacterium sp. RSB2_4_14 TaxID=3447665 RepID=UPI003F35D283
MQKLPAIGDVVMIKSNNTIWADEKGYFIISRLDRKNLPIEIIALTKSNSHQVGDIIINHQLINCIYPIKLKASNLINQVSLLLVNDKFEKLPIVHFLGNNRIIEFVHYDEKIVSNVEFEFFQFPNKLLHGRLVFHLTKPLEKRLILNFIFERFKNSSLFNRLNQI